MLLAVNTRVVSFCINKKNYDFSIFICLFILSLQMLPIICEVTVAMNTNRITSFANPEYQSELESDLDPELITILLWDGC